MKPGVFAGAVAVAAGAALLARPAGADEVFLTGGGRVSGEVVERRADRIMVDVGPGRVTLPLSRVVRVVPGTSAVAVYRERAARLSPQDGPGRLALGLWAQEHDLLTLARDAFERVLLADPGNEAAHRALGHVLLGGRWVTEEESHRARGHVLFEGTWMSPAQARAISSERAAEAEARRAAREAEARAQEAEARAREAEAEARRAELEAQETGQPGGIPYAWVLSPPFGFTPHIRSVPNAPFDGVVPPITAPTKVIVNINPPRRPPPRDRSAPAPARTSTRAQARTNSVRSGPERH